MSTHSSFTDVLAAHWSDDFAPLEDAGKALLSALREDENAPDADLYRRIGAFGNGSHQYFAATAPVMTGNGNSHVPTTPLGMAPHPTVAPSNPPPTIRMAHDHSVPLPPFMSQQLQLVKSASFMGLMPKAELAWLTVDDKLFLWPYSVQRGGEGSSFCSFAVPNGQCVLSVGLVPPKAGVFCPSVKWCLVVTTAEEVMLCALIGTKIHYGSNGDPSENHSLPDGTGSFRLVPTRFSVPTDNVRMLCVCGTPKGRIFLGGEDGCLYEMAYENPDPLAPSNRSAATLGVDKQLEQFYDHGKHVPATIKDRSTNGWTDTGKRLLLGSAGMEHRPRKCRKLNHSSHVSSLASAVVPDFLLKATSFVLGAGKSSTGGGSIVKMVVDEERSCLYTLGSKGWICAFSLLQRGQDSGARLAAVMNAPETARLYLDAVARQRMTPPSSRSFKIGNITFAGGGSAAQKGVGGMDGARNILSLAKLNGDSQNVLMPASLHVVPRRESGRITLIAVTKGGLRYFISSLSANTLALGASRSSEGMETLAPAGGRLSLCHIRAPPPLEDEARQQDLATSTDTDDAFPVGGFVPKMSNAVNKMPVVDAGFCRGDAMVLAIRKPKTKSGTKGDSLAGDHIVTATPDFVLRRGKRELAGVKHVAPGGVSETLSLPLSNTSSTNCATVLPGGIVSDIGESSASRSSILKLALNSRTPTDTELSVGLVPEFIPEEHASKRSNHTRRVLTGGGNSSRDAVTASSNSLASTAMKVALNLIPNLILSRPLNQGITFLSPNHNVAPMPASRPAQYHTSKRFGTRGFSLTAADQPSNNKKQDTRKSPRLNPWLLQPAAAPLNPLTLQHLLPPSQVVVMNSGGLHHFRLNSILSAFEDAIVAAGENVELDERVTSFFSSFGYPEGCAMCVMLALGIRSGGVNHSLKDYASRAVNTRAYSPKLTPVVPGGNGLVADSVQGSDPLLPKGYAFRSSALLEGIVKVTARLLRPVWHKPLVVVTEGRTVLLKWKAEKRVTPSKVELLLDDATLAQILQSLNSLAELMKKWFTQAIESVPGKLRVQSNMMEIDDRSGQSLAITDAFVRQSHLRDSSGVSNGQLAPSEAERLAKLTEERKIHSIYRLVTRSRQLLQLFGLLSRAHRAMGLPEVEWGSMHGLTVSQLVQTRDGQDRLEKMLNNLVTSTADYNYGLSEPSAETDQLATEFADQCYLFFSPGSRYAYLGFSFGQRALACSEGSARRLELTATATKHFLRAAKHWHSPSLVTGRSLHIRSQEGYEQVAKEAYAGGSPVAKAASVLADLGEVDAVVDVCLITAANFGMVQPMAIVAVDHPESKAFVWENDLYHKRQAQQEPSTVLNGSGSTPASPSSRALTLGTSVTASDAMTTCWFLIFHHMTIMLQRPELRPLAERMVSRCASESSEQFLHAFFRHLQNSGNTETLLSITSPDVERWLDRDVQDQDLLYKYYSIQRAFKEAGTLSLSRAKDDREKMPLIERIEWLSKAIAACSASREYGGKNGWTNHGEAQIETEAKDFLDIAKLQLRVLEASSQADLSPSEREPLSSSLMKASDLFHFADEHCHYDICLLVMHTCKENNAPYIENLWRQIFCSAIFPCSTREASLYTFLGRYQSDFSTDSLVSLLDGNSDSDETIPFEDGSWKMKLEMKVKSLGRELYGRGADFVFPVEFIYKELERLRRVYTETVPGKSDMISRAWSMKLLTDVGVRYAEVLNACELVDAQDEQIGLLGRGDTERLDQLTGIVFLLNDWVREGLKKPEVKQELSQAYHSISLSDKIRAWKHELDRMNAAPLIQSLEAVEAELPRLLRGSGGVQRYF